MRALESEEAEQTCTDIRIIEAEHLRATTQRTRTSEPRIQGSALELESRALQLVLANIVAVTEHFCDDRLRVIPGATQTATTWPKRETAWLQIGLDLNNIPSYLPFRGFNEARNAIMHGLGALTPNQLKANYVADVRARLTASSIRIARNRVIIADADIGRCADACIDFVQQLDAAAP